MRENRCRDPQEVIHQGWREEFGGAGQWFTGQDMETVVPGGIVQIRIYPPSTHAHMPSLFAMPLTPPYAPVA